MGRERKKIGSLGEKLALDFLKAKGYRVKYKNFRTPFGELDIVTEYKGSIVFIVT